MRFLLIYTLFGTSVILQAQNSLRLISRKGVLFTAYINDRPVNINPQASVLLEKIIKDTLYLKIAFEDSPRYGITVYLLNKGRHTTQQEFNYLLTQNKNKIDVDFSGIYEADALPDPIVPAKQLVDTSRKYSNTVLDHFCEIKDNKAVYFNNLPKEGSCTTAMPDAYLNYTGILMRKASTQDEKYNIAENVCRNNCIRVAQLNALLTYVDYEIEKLKLVRFAYFNLVDVTEKKELEKSFKFEASVNELNSFFKNAADYKIKSASSCIKASPEDDIQKFMERITAYSADGQRYEALKKLYADHCYSVNQVIAVLQKFLHDREKLEAAKLLYFNCVEKAAYTNVSVVFSYGQSAADLNDFMEKQKQ